MTKRKKVYIAIDLKSFYASVECVERGLDPLDTCLVVADESRTPKTICLAVSPALKAYGTGGRPRLFEVIAKVGQANVRRGRNGKSFSAKELKARPDMAIDYIIAPPRMALYIDYSTRIYDIYLRYISPEDIHIYSIDEVFMDITDYLDRYGLSPHELTMKLIRSVLRETGITATAGIGTNLYLSKVAMDIVAKKMPPDDDGVRIAELDERAYRENLWDHLPLTDFWRVGRGTVNKLLPYSIFTMGDIARTSINHESLLFKLFGVNAELLIDHAWGWEPVTLQQVKTYRPESKSISSGQVLQRPYSPKEARNVVLEMADAVSYDLIEKNLATDQIVLTIGYDVESLTNNPFANEYKGKVRKDFYGRNVPEHSHGTINMDFPTASSSILTAKTAELFDRIINQRLLVRRINLTLNNLIDQVKARRKRSPLQPDLFSDYEEIIRKSKEETEFLEKEERRQKTILELRRKFGKNIVLKGLNYTDGSTQKDRNNQIGGHHK